MRLTNTENLLVGSYYQPTSYARKHMGGYINFAEKRDDVWVDNATAYAIRFRVENTILDRWATIAVANV